MPAAISPTTAGCPTRRIAIPPRRAAIKMTKICSRSGECMTRSTCGLYDTCSMRLALFLAFLAVPASAAPVLIEAESALQTKQVLGGDLTSTLR